MSLRYTGNGSAASSSFDLKCTDLPQFDALLAQSDRFETDSKLHLRNLCNDSARCTGLVTTHICPSKQGPRTIVFDYSRQRITGETMELLFDLADAVKMTERREAMRTGFRINSTENRPVLHHVLRMPEDFPINLRCRQFDEPMGNMTNDAPSLDQQKLLENGPTLLREVHKLRRQVQQFSERVRSGVYKPIVQGEVFDSVLCVGLAAGSQIGPEFVTKALEADPTAHRAAKGRTIRFLSNVDPVDFFRATNDLNAARTLVLIVSQSFADTDTLLVARTVEKWLMENIVSDGGDTKPALEKVVARHMVAVSDNPVRCRQFGIAPENTFSYMAICGRYSLCSPAGILPLALHYSYPVVCDFLDGAHEIDQHFFHSPLHDNIPVILGLLGVWNSTFLGYTCRAIIPYSHALSLLPSYVQKIDMESNGKRVALDGTDLLHQSAEVDFGAIGTASQQSLFQLLHQGREIPADFIGFMESQQAVDLPGEAVSNHDELMSHFFAQPDALAYGKTLVDLMQEGTPERLRPHMLFPGNRPSSSLLMTKLDAFALGQLVAIYEHRTAIQGFIWGINSFDQFGGELGQTLSKQVRSQLSASRKTGASVQGFNVSTGRLLEQYLAHQKQG